MFKSWQAKNSLTTFADAFTYFQQYLSICRSFFGHGFPVSGIEPGLLTVTAIFVANPFEIPHVLFWLYKNNTPILTC